MPLNYELVEANIGSKRSVIPPHFLRECSCFPPFPCVCVCKERAVVAKCRASLGIRGIEMVFCFAPIWRKGGRLVPLVPFLCFHVDLMKICDFQISSDFLKASPNHILSKMMTISMYQFNILNYTASLPSRNNP